MSQAGIQAGACSNQGLTTQSGCVPCDRPEGLYNQKIQDQTGDFLAMAFHPDGVKFVLTAPDTESTEQAFSPWKQMMYASVPAQFLPRFFHKNKFEQPRNAEGSAKVMTYG